MMLAPKPPEEMAAELTRLGYLWLRSDELPAGYHNRFVGAGDALYAYHGITEFGWYPLIIVGCRKYRTLTRTHTRQALDWWDRALRLLKITLPCGGCAPDQKAWGKRRDALQKRLDEHIRARYPGAQFWRLPYLGAQERLLCSFCIEAERIVRDQRFAEANTIREIGKVLREVGKTEALIQ